VGLVLPVPVQLVEQLVIPVRAHERWLDRNCGQDRSAIAGILEIVLDTSGGLLRLLAILPTRPARTGPELASAPK
jgi:hypothetical protein